MALPSIGNHNAQQIDRTDIQNMDLESAFLLVNHQRLDNSSRVLRDQISDIQDRNIQVSKNNDMMSAARSLLAGFPSDSKSDAAIIDDSVPENPETKKTDPETPDQKDIDPEKEKKTRYLKEFQDACEKAGFDAKSIKTKGELSAAIENIKSKVDSLSNTQTAAMLRTQLTQNSYNETVSSITNFMKNMHDLKSSIIQKTY